MKRTLCILLVSLLGFFTTNAFTAPPYTHYAIVIDAGSTGTRLHLFEYRASKVRLPQIDEIYSQESLSTLASFAKEPSQAGTSLRPLLDQALQFCQQKEIDASRVNISIFGTAGLRLLSQETQKGLYQSSSNTLQQAYPFKIQSIRTLSGKEEALFGWLDVNYLMQTLEHAETPTLGSIDMGGASTQIAFATWKNNPSPDVVKLELGSQEYHVYAKSFLGMGFNEAIRSINQEPRATNCYPSDYPLHLSQNGHFNFASCKNLFAHLVEKSHMKVEPLLNQHFVAYSGIYYTYGFFGLKQKSSQTNFNRAIQSCHQDWKTFQAQHPESNTQELANICPRAVYLSQLLYNHYGLSSRRLIVTQEIHHHHLDWTLGALFYQITQKAKLA